MTRMLTKRFLLLFVLLALLASFISCGRDKTTEIVYEDVTIDKASYSDFEDGSFRAYVLNVGQASCLVVESDGEYAVVDAGDKSSADYVFKAISDKNYVGATRISYLFFTHFDADHIGAGPGLVEKLKVNEVYGPNYVPDNQTREYKSLVQKMKAKGLKMREPTVGKQLELGSITITIIAPSKEFSEENENSIALLFEDQYGHTLYVGGDSGEKSERMQISQIEKVDVYIVNHHGAKESSSSNFINAIQPKYAVISCAKENTYGHPHQEVLDRLNSVGCEVFYTYNVKKGENLSIVFTEDDILIH